MDVSVILTLFVALSISHTEAQDPQLEPVRNTTNSVERAKECLTARNVSGICIQRNSCDYTAGVIDLTLYAHHAYKRPCDAVEVCCPEAAIVRLDTATPVTPDSDEDED